MQLLHIIRPCLLALTLLVSVSDNSRVIILADSVGYAGHGLRVFIDPDTGRYTPPSPASTEAIPLTRLTGSTTAQPPLREIRSAKTGGGYTIDLQARFRPLRRDAPLTKKGI